METNFKEPGRHSRDDRLIATTAAHDAFRRDLRQLTIAAMPSNLRNAVRYGAIMNGRLVEETDARTN